MKITEIETFVVDAGWRPWTYVKVSTDEGIVGYGECSSKSTYGVVGAIRDLRDVLIGKDPRAYEARWWDMYRTFRSGTTGIGARAMAGIELALIDIAAKSLGVSVVQMFGGPTRDRVRVYWSHCGTSRIRAHELLGVSPLRNWDDVAALGREVASRGFTALKTNILIPGDPGHVYLPGFSGTTGRDLYGPDGAVSREIRDNIETLIGTFRDAVGPNIDINLDLNYNFKPEACIQIARTLEPYNLLWLEIDMEDPLALLEVRRSTTTRICTGESLYQMRQYLPYLQNHVSDILMIDVPWNGFTQSKKIGELANVFEYNIAPHNHYSHLASHISASLCATLPNVRIMEIDIDDVPWKDELVTNPPRIVDGYMMTPTGPGWGTDLNEEVVRAHPWTGKKLPKRE
jgi:galactonate dehydratase